MSTTAVDSFKRQEELVLAHTWAKVDPKPLIAQMKGFDPTLQEYFSFQVDAGDPNREDKSDFDYRQDWGWQSLMVDLWMGRLSPEQEVLLKELCGWWDGLDRKSRKFIVLKARQLGVTWVAVALGLWFILYRPGANVVAYSHGLEDSKKLIQRAWLMFNSLDPFFRQGVDVLYPDRGELPSDRIVLRHPDGRLSNFLAFPDTAKAGHGDTVTLAIGDEMARQQYARGIYAAINPALSRGGIFVGVSTADGVSNPETEEGNFFHLLWAKRKARRIQPIFLPWDLHPERDEEWYEVEAMALPDKERAQQFPRTPEEAFILSGDLYFDSDSLEFYRKEIDHLPRRERGAFIVMPGEGGKLVYLPNGIIEIMAHPRPGVKYVIGADSATGRAADYSVAHVMDLDSSEIMAKIRCKLGFQDYGDQLKLLGRWYNNALIIAERTGVGEALISSLRNDANGLRPYGNLYQHVRPQDIGKDISSDFGFPMNVGTRTTVLEGLRRHVKERRFPFILPGDLAELQTFVYRETKPSPRAMDGTNDDCVMSLALTLHGFAQRGVTPEKENKKKKWKRKPYEPPPTRTH